MFTPETFDEYITKVNRYIKVNPPRCNDEFRIYTRLLYGVELNCKCHIYYPSLTDLIYSSEIKAKGDYCIKEKEDDYRKIELYRCWERKFGWYDGLKELLNSTFGPLYCGGVASSHYGQFQNISREKAEYLQHWDRPLDDMHKLLKEIEILQLIDGLENAI